MNWPSNATNYTIESSPFCQARRSAGRSCDLVGEFLASCDKYNITRGLYYTVSNNHCRTVPSGGAPGNTTCNDMLRNAFTELATSYGPIGQFWFDHGNELFLDLVDKYQPGASIAGREWTLVGTEGGFVLNGPNSLWSPAFPMGTANNTENTWLAYQCDTSLSNSGWFWHNGAAPRYNASQAVDLYGLQCIGVGAGLILNLPPSTRGVVEPVFVTWATDFATEWDRRFGTPEVQPRSTVHNDAS
jgi:alpha-L-fucosidase